jgi:hypothetical protein
MTWPLTPGCWTSRSPCSCFYTLDHLSTRALLFLLDATRCSSVTLVLHRTESRRPVGGSPHSPSRHPTRNDRRSLGRHLTRQEIGHAMRHSKCYDPCLLTDSRSRHDTRSVTRNHARHPTRNDSRHPKRYLTHNENRDSSRYGSRYGSRFGSRPNLRSIPRSASRPPSSPPSCILKRPGLPPAPPRPAASRSSLLTLRHSCLNGHWDLGLGC